MQPVDEQTFERKSILEALLTLRELETFSHDWRNSEIFCHNILVVFLFRLALDFSILCAETIKQAQTQ